MRRPEHFRVHKMKLGILAHTHAYIMTGMTMQIVDNLKSDRNPKTENHNQHHDQLVDVLGLSRVQKIAHTKQAVLRVENQIVDNIAETGAARFQIKIAEYVNKRADKVVELLENLLACIILVLRRDTIVGLQPQYPKVHDKPVSEHNHKEPRTKSGCENGHC